MKGVNKSQAVRDYLRDHPRAKPKAIAEALAKEGTQITEHYISKIKSTCRKRGRPVGSVTAKRGLGMPQIRAALALLKVCGSPGAAKAALAAAAEIKALV
jgi:hypothetical protein